MALLVVLRSALQFHHIGVSLPLRLSWLVSPRVRSFARGTLVQTEFTKMMAGFFGGEGFVLQRLTGQGDAFVKARCGKYAACSFDLFLVWIWLLSACAL